MNDQSQGRMLLSHNYNLPSDGVPPLSRDAFAAVFERGLSDIPTCQTKLLNHPHWMVEIVFDGTTLTPQFLGEHCAQALVDARKAQGFTEAQLPHLLILGGLKMTPATSTTPETLQPGEWGVDVVETPSGAAFLQEIGWQSTIAQRPAESVFMVERSWGD